jgi:hypothetical protein
MATWKPEIFDIDGLIGFYDQYDTANYIIYAGHKPEPNYVRGEYRDNDKNIGREHLINALIALKNNAQNTNTYLLQLVENKRTKNTPSVTFQLNQRDMVSPYMPMVMPHNNNNDLIIQKLNGIESRINAIEEDEEEVEIEDDKPSGINGIIDTLLQNEQIQIAMINAATSFLGKFMPKNQQTAISGIPEEQDEKIMSAISILKQHNELLGDDLLKLADMAQNNNGQFNFLLSMLRK